MGFSIINHPFWDTPSIYGNPHINDACIPTFPRSKMQSATRRTASGRSGHGVGFRSECRRATAMGTGNENGHWQRKRELKSNPQVICPHFFCNMSVLSILIILLWVAGSNQWNLFGSILWRCKPGLGDGSSLDVLSRRPTCVVGGKFNGGSCLYSLKSVIYHIVL